MPASLVYPWSFGWQLPHACGSHHQPHGAYLTQGPFSLYVSGNDGVWPCRLSLREPSYVSGVWPCRLALRERRLAMSITRIRSGTSARAVSCSRRNQTIYPTTTSIAVFACVCVLYVLAVSMVQPETGIRARQSAVPPIPPNTSIGAVVTFAKRPGFEKSHVRYTSALSFFLGWRRARDGGCVDSASLATRAAGPHAVGHVGANTRTCSEARAVKPKL